MDFACHDIYMASPAVAPKPIDPVNVQIRNVPDAVHRRLKAKAALEGMSLSEYLLAELVRIADRKSNKEVWRELQRDEPAHLPDDYVASLIRQMRGPV